MSKFYVGQKVVCVSEGFMFLTKGTIYTAESVNSGGLKVKGDAGKPIWYAFGVFKPASFTKSDLKDGMVVTYENGDERYVLSNALYVWWSGKQRLEHAMALSSFSETLECLVREKRSIVKVEYMGEVLWERQEESERDKKLRVLKEEAAKAQQSLDAIQKEIEGLDSK